ncbi:hypothetical protein F5Y17DRAFT_471569 [Xylariaceae sp. FL0594]|nr:hypothetical protein F5Y17DRAFT_471569 [Xylariaceae sp. FL0594]
MDNAVDPDVPDLGPKVEDWRPVFWELGLSDELYTAIVDPAYSMIRKTETAKYWIRDTMEIRYGSQSDQGGRRLPLALAEPDDPIPEDFVGDLFEGPFVTLVQDRAVGVLYANYARRRLQGDDGTVLLLRILVKRSCFREDHLEGDDWKKVVFLCRSGRPLQANHPDDRASEELGVDKYGGSKVLVGPISQAVAEEEEEVESWTCVTGLPVPATQWVFKGKDTLKQLEQNSIVNIDAQFARTQN